MGGLALSEFEIQKAVVQHLNRRLRPGVYFMAIPNGEKRSPVTGARLKAMGVRPGAPDLLILVSGKAIGIELKTEKGRTTVEQLDTCHEWDGAGGSYLVARGIDQALSMLVDIGAIHPEGVGA